MKNELEKTKIQLEKDLVSVIIPCFNVGCWLKDCLNSLLWQTYKKFEVIFVDDGSTDQTASILDSFCSQNSFAKVIHQKNAGVSTARNLGLSLSRGEFIYYLDPDDYIHPKALEILVSAIKSQDADFSFFDANFLQVKGEESDEKVESRLKNPSEKQIKNAKFQILEGSDKIVSEYFSRHLTLAVWNKLFRHELLQKVETYPNINDIECPFAEDVEFNFWFLLQTKKAVHAPLKLYYYRIHKKGVVRSKFKTAQLTVLNGFDRMKKIDASKYPNSPTYIRSLESTVAFTLLQKIYNSDFSDVETTEKIYRIFKGGFKYIRKGKRNPFYIKLLPCSTPYAYVALRKVKRRRKKNEKNLQK